MASPIRGGVKFLNHVEFALNTTSAQGTGISPVELVFGCKLHHPVDIVFSISIV